MKRRTKFLVEIILARTVCNIHRHKCTEGWPRMRAYPQFWTHLKVYANDFGMCVRTEVGRAWNHMNKAQSWSVRGVYLRIEQPEGRLRSTAHIRVYMESRHTGRTETVYTVDNVKFMYVYKVVWVKPCAQAEDGRFVGGGCCFFRREFIFFRSQWHNGTSAQLRST